MVVLLITWLLMAFAAPAAHAAAGCGTAPNPIVCENALPGTDPSLWDIQGSGDDSIQGFSTDISVNVGGTIGFKVDTNAKAYTVQIFRTGYYQGLGARKIADVKPSATLPQVQPPCVTDATTELYDCGNWGLSASWAVPSDAVSGVYIALLTRTDTGGKSQITFIVRNEASHSAVLFQTSDPTWQAYNTYGGSDFYQGAANGRAYKISYNRPISTRDYYDGRDFYFANEYPAVRFLEKNGYDVSYFSGVDSDRFGADLKNHKVFLSVGHDEYWSAAQRNNVIAARDAGVNLQFLSGNEMYWHTRYEPSVAGTPTNYRTLVSYKETWSNAKIDPSAEWTGTYRDPRFASQANGAGIPENSVTGTMYQSTISDLAVTVTAAQGKARMWRNTGLSSMASGTTTALAAHTVGYESDEDVDNGFRPAGLVDLSTTTAAVTQEMLDFGSTTGPATTTHHVTLYRAASGALVFSAGSIQWTWGLDQEHDGSGAAADPRMQQAQVNLLADMGAQPATLQSGLVAATASTDHTPPTVTINTPASGASIANGAAVTVTGTAADVGGVVAGVEVSTNGGTIWHPATGTTSWTYTYYQAGVGMQGIMVRATDDSGNWAASPATRSVTTTGPYSALGNLPPAVADSGDPAPVEVGLKFTPSQNGYISGVRFYKSAANTGTHKGSLWNASGTRLATVTFTNETASGWQTATFASFVAVTAGTTYIVSYGATNGHYSATQNYWSYRGVSAAPLTVAGGFGSAPAGVYNTTPGLYPTSTYNQTNYYVDAVFTTTDTSPLSASGQWPLPRVVERARHDDDRCGLLQRRCPVDDRVHCEGSAGSDRSRNGVIRGRDTNGDVHADERAQRIRDVLGIPDGQGHDRPDVVVGPDLVLYHSQTAGAGRHLPMRALHRCNNSDDASGHRGAGHPRPELPELGGGGGHRSQVLQERREHRYARRNPLLELGSEARQCNLHRRIDGRLADRRIQLTRHDQHKYDLHRGVPEHDGQLLGLAWGPHLGCHPGSTDR